MMPKGDGAGNQGIASNAEPVLCRKRPGKCDRSFALAVAAFRDKRRNGGMVPQRDSVQVEETIVLVEVDGDAEERAEVGGSEDLRFGAVG